MKIFMLIIFNTVRIKKYILMGLSEIAAAPDFIQDLWLQNQDQNQNRNKADDSKSNNDAVHIKSRYERSSYRIYITSKLVEDAKKNWEILPSSTSKRKKEAIESQQRNLAVHCPVYMYAPRKMRRRYFVPEVVGIVETLVNSSSSSSSDNYSNKTRFKK